MKFTCDSCRSQYMISDEKVGPNGVKVRCKKCGNVVLVRRAAEVAATMAAAPPAPVAAPSPEPSGDGLDVELGNAFDNAFGDAPRKEEPSKEEPAPDLGATQAMTPEDAAKIAAPGTAPAAPASAPAASEWYVAIGEAQVGPLPLSEVKKKWETGDVGPDSLVWRPGMADWAPLTTVSDLAGYLAPVPQPVRARPGPDLRAEPSSATPPPPREEPTWKPAGASALAALASEEIAARSAPVQPRPAARPAGGGNSSLVEAMNLPDSGGVDPTGAIPLAIKGLEPSIEKKLTTVARGAEEIRHRRSATKAVLTSVVVTLVILGVGAVALVTWLNGRLAAGQAPVAVGPFALPGTRSQKPAAAPAPPPPAAPAPPAAVPAPSAAAPGPAAVAQAASAERAKAEPRRAEAEKPEVAKPAPPHMAAKEPEREPPGKRGHPEAARAKREKEPPRVAAREEPPPPPAPQPPAPKKKSDLLDFEGGGGGDTALDEALGKAPSGRSVYVPPKPAAAGGDLPAQLTDSQIQGAVLGNLDALRKCVADQKARDAQATGTLQMRWMILGDGSPRDVKCVTPEFASAPFAQCIGSILRSTRFPRSATRGQTVTMPFKF